VTPYRTAPLPAAVLLLTAATGCSMFADPGPATTQDRTVAAVTGVRLETSGDLSIGPGAAPRLTVTAGSEVIDRLTSDVQDGVLVLDVDGRVVDMGDVHYTLTLPRLDSLVVNGSGDVEAGSVPAGALAIEVNGSGDVELGGVAVDQLQVALTGSGNLETQGSAAAQDVRVQGSGDYDGSSLDSRQATVTVSGSGDADVRVTGTLTAVISGSGDIEHTGGAEVSSTVQGSGEVVPG
jgi:Putative auto-transporter adhesin, head GIN domain